MHFGGPIVAKFIDIFAKKRITIVKQNRSALKRGIVKARRDEMWAQVKVMRAEKKAQAKEICELLVSAVKSQNMKRPCIPPGGKRKSTSEVVTALNFNTTIIWVSASGLVTAVSAPAPINQLGQGAVETQENVAANGLSSCDEQANAASPCMTAASSTDKTRPRKTRPPCQMDGCKNITVSFGFCGRHGGGTRCTIDGCTNLAKLYKRCFRHGGSKTCSVGDCWAHGGGNR